MYWQLVNWTVRLYIVLFAVASTLGNVVVDDGNIGGLTTSVFYLLIPFVFEYFMFVGWLSLADALGNPFRAWADEFEYENYIKGVVGAHLESMHHYIPSTPLDELDAISREIGIRQAAMLSRWDRSTSKDHETVREKLTGFY